MERPPLSSGPSELDKEQMRLPYILAATKFGNLREGKRSEFVKAFLGTIDSTVRKIIPDEVSSAVEGRFPELSTVISDVGFERNGHIAPGVAKFDQSNRLVELEFGLPLLFAPKLVSATMIAHEYAHLYFRATEKVFLGRNIPSNCAILQEYGYDYPMIEEELEVDRLTKSWGLGDRNEYLLWESAVFQTRRLDCEDIYAQLRGSIGQ